MCHNNQTCRHGDYLVLATAPDLLYQQHLPHKVSSSEVVTFIVIATQW